MEYSVRTLAFAITRSSYRMKVRGCDSVILGCTEIPCSSGPDDCPLPVLDSTRLLARAAVDAALQRPAATALDPDIERRPQ